MAFYDFPRDSLKMTHLVIERIMSIGSRAGKREISSAHTSPTMWSIEMPAAGSATIAPNGRKENTNGIVN